MIDNNGGAFVTSIKKDLFDRYKKESVKFKAKADEILKIMIDDMNITDTGYLESKSRATITVNNSEEKLVTFQYSVVNVPYAFYVHEGKGTNQRYGARAYLRQSALALRNYIATGTFERM